MRMKLTLAALAILFGLPLEAAPLPEGKVVHTNIYTGAIFTSAMMENSDGDPFDPKIVEYWTPSSALIDQAEKTFRRELTKAYVSIPPEGFHYQAWYTPKHYSRDRTQARPIDFFSQEFYGWDPKEVATWCRQYIGVTIAGKRALLVNLVNSTDQGWKSDWISALGGPTRFYFVPKTGELSEWPF